uniref:Transmembrane protein 59 n=1 Tax=Gasterosteus aculeatus TaxID=69293 RepID=G3PX59_GASAC
TLAFSVCTLGLLALFACTSTSADVFDSVLGSTSSCHKSCEMTYSLHTFPRVSAAHSPLREGSDNEEELYACQRGCRLFSICQFVRDGDDLNQTKSECESTCREAYSHSDEQYACNLGCQNQLPFAEQRHEQLEAMMPRIHMLYPMTLVRGFWDDVMNQAHSFITSTWTFYLQADDGKTEPHVQFFSLFEVEKEEEPQKSCRFSTPFSYDPIIIQKVLLVESELDFAYTFTHERDRDMTGDRGYDDQYNLFNCLSRNPWLPGWILTTTLILSVVVLIWICCATVATAVDQYV